MALKLEFSAQFKDAQLIQGAIKNLQKELVDLGKTGANASNELNKSMKGVYDSISKINEVSKGTGGLKELNNQLNALVKMNTGISSIAREFDTLGRAVNANLGGSAETIIKRFKNNIADMKSDLERQGQAFTRLQDRMGFIKSRYGEDSPIYQRALAVQQSRAVGMTYAESAIDDAEMDLRLSKPRAFLGGRNLRQVTGAAGLPAAIGETIFSASTMDVRSEIAQRNLATQYGRDVLAGDPTLAILRGTGAGIADGQFGAAKGGAYLAEYGKEILKYAGIIAGGLLGGPMGAMLGAGLATSMGGGFRGFGEINADAVERMRSLDKALYSPAMSPAYQSYLTSHNRFHDFYKMRGDEESNRLVARLMSSGAGLSMDQLAPALSAASYYGLNMPGYGSDIDLVSAMRDYGITEYSQRQLVRLARAGGPYGRTNAMAGLTRLLGGSGVGGDINSRRIVADIAFRNLEGMGAETDIAQAGAFMQSATRAMGETGIYKSGLGGIGSLSVEGAQVAAAATQGVQQQLQSPMSFANMMLDMKLISLGITDIGLRQTLITAISTVGTTKGVINTIQKVRAATGRPLMSDVEIRDAITGAGQAIAGARDRAFGANSMQAKIAESEGISVPGFYAAGAKGIFNKEYEAQQRVFREIGQEARGGEADIFTPTGAEQIEGGKGKMTAKELEAFQDLGEKYSELLHTTIYKSISQALIDTGSEIARELKEVVQLPPTTPGTGFYGAKGGKQGR